jgi:hypothetical protein
MTGRSTVVPVGRIQRRGAERPEEEVQATAGVMSERNLAIGLTVAGFTMTGAAIAIFTTVGVVAVPAVVGGAVLGGFGCLTAVAGVIRGCVYIGRRDTDSMQQNAVDSDDELRVAVPAQATNVIGVDDVFLETIEPSNDASAAPPSLPKSKLPSPAVAASAVGVMRGARIAWK